MAHKGNIIGIGHHLETASWDALHHARHAEGIVRTRPSVSRRDTERVITFLRKVVRQAEVVGW